MKTIAEITTDRLQIALASNEEMEQVIAAENDPELKQAYGEMLQGALAHPEMRELYAMWFIRLREKTDIVVGDMCFKGLSEGGMVEIGYGIYPAYMNQGYATEAVQALTVWVMRREGVKSVEAEAEESNAASLRVLEKCGFRPNGKMGEEGSRFTCQKQR